MLPEVVNNEMLNMVTLLYGKNGLKQNKNKQVKNKDKLRKNKKHDKVLVSLICKEQSHINKKGIPQ